MPTDREYRRELHTPEPWRLVALAVLVLWTLFMAAMGASGCRAMPVCAQDCAPRNAKRASQSVVFGGFVYSHEECECEAPK